MSLADRIKPWHLALAGGAGVGSIILAVLVVKKKREFEVQANAMRAQLTNDMATGVYARQLDALRVELGAYAETVANRAADEHIAQTYGLTPARMEGLRRLAAVFR